MNNQAKKPLCGVSLSGAFRMTLLPDKDIQIRSKRGKAIIAMVALAKGGVRTRKWLQDKLWSESDEKAGAASLRQELSSIRKIETAYSIKLLDITRETVSISRSALKIDLLSGEKLEEGQTILEGLDVDDNEFEEWLTIERSKWECVESQVPDTGENAVKKLNETVFRKPIIVVQPIDFTDIGQETETLIFDELMTSLGALSGDIEVFESMPDQCTEALMLLQISLRNGQGVRANIRIIRATDKKTVWSERFLVGNVAAYPSHVALCRKVLEGVQTAITDGHMSIIWSRYPTTLHCWDSYQRGRKQESIGNRIGHRRARELYRRALRLDPSFVPARIVEAFVLIDEIRLGWSSDPVYDTQYVETQYDSVIQDAPNEPYAHIMKCYILNLKGEFSESCRLMDFILSQIPENPELLAYQALLLEANDELERAMALYRKALRLTAFPPNWIRVNLALATLVSGATNPSRPLLEDAIQNNQESIRALIGLAVLEVRSGKFQKAREYASRIQILQPDFDAKIWRVPKYFKNPEKINHVARELSSIGL